MRRRWVMGSMGRVVAIAALVCGVWCDVAFTEPARRYVNPAAVCIRLTVVDDLSGPAFITVKDEATRIWDRHGVVLNWTPSPAQTCRTVVPIVFDGRELRKQGGTSSANALGLTVFHGRAQTIYVSIPRSFQMLADTNRLDKAVATQGERDYRGGLLIGRVVAHELGHVLLTTLSHSETGLMRPVFGVRDVLSTDDTTTDLSPIDTSRLVMRFSLVPFDTPGPQQPSVLARSEAKK